MGKRVYDDATTLDLLAGVQSQLLDYAPVVTQSMVINGQARYLRWDFRKLALPKLDLLQMTDLQFGHKQCDVTKIQEYLAWVLEAESRYIFLTGDLLDAGHVQSKGSPFEQIGEPQEELWRLCDLLAPVRHRVLGYTGGNHERRTIATFGDIGKSIATILKIPYSPGKQHIDIQFGEHKPFKTTLFHGGGSAATPGSIVNSLVKFMYQADSDLYLEGHLHQAAMWVGNREVRDGKGGMRLQKIVGARGSSFLNHYGTYAEVIMGTNPSTISMPKATLEKNGHWEVNFRQ